MKITNELFQEAIELEMNVYELYSIFHDYFPEDADFWWEISLEEKNHAALIRSGQEHLAEMKLFPDEILPDSLETIKEENEKIRQIIEKWKQIPGTRKEAFQTAFQLENSAGEAHFQEAMTEDKPSKVLEIFQQLNEEDKDHAQRIKNYLEEKNI